MKEVHRYAMKTLADLLTATATLAVAAFISTSFTGPAYAVDTPQAEGLVSTEKEVMGTTLKITLSLKDKEEAGRLFALVEREFQRVEGVMSEWMEGSAISLINEMAGKGPVKVSSELFSLIEGGLGISRLSGGAFDITWAAMKGLWDFRPGSERMAKESEIKELLPLIGYEKVVLDRENRSVFLREEGMRIGLGAIAKGYAVDRASMILAREGVEGSIITAGGDMRLQGKKRGGEGGSEEWRVSIRHPRKRGPLAKLILTNTSVSTSGDYERFFIKDEVIYHHIIDPRTGYPARGSMSVTILAPDTMTSDALSTAVFVMGPEKGLKLVNSLNGVEAIIVDQLGRVLTSRGIDLKGTALEDGQSGKVKEERKGE